MTTIACDGKTMAADSRTSSGGDRIVDDQTTKIGRTKEGWIVGAAGRGGALRLAIEALNAGNAPKIKGTTVIALLPDGTGRQYEEDGHWTDVLWPYSCGSGRDFALALLDAGFSPEKAVLGAAKRDPFTGGPVTILRRSSQRKPRARTGAR